MTRQFTTHVIAPAAIALALMPIVAFAAGSSSSDAPAPTPTTEQCAEGLVFDLATQSCMTAAESTNDDQAMMDDIRALSHEGRYADALGLLEKMEDQADPLVLTYYGFATRKAGDVPAGMAFYAEALAIDPDFILARSYMGQAHVEAGEMELAQAQLTEIRARGGSGTWAEWSLASAINTGEGYSY